MEKENKVWLDENGIVNVIVVGSPKVKDMEELSKKVKDFSRKVSTQRRVLVDLTRCDPLSQQSTHTRKIGGETVREIFDYVGLKKAALFSENLAMRTIISFLAAATGRKNKIGVFKSKEEALEWLNEP